MKLITKLLPRSIVTKIFLKGIALGYRYGYTEGLLKARTELTKLLADACQCDDEWTCQATDIERQLRSLIGKETA